MLYLGPEEGKHQRDSSSGERKGQWERQAWRREPAVVGLPDRRQSAAIDYKRGRINGSEIGRREKIQVGKVPLSTIREDIDYASYPSLTKKGYIGVKVWINKPEMKGI